MTSSKMGYEVIAMVFKIRQRYLFSEAALFPFSAA